MELKRTVSGTSVAIHTPNGKGYSLEIDVDGNVTEYISGNYVRVVLGNVIEKTLGIRIDETLGPSLVKSANYVALSAPEVHLNPEELERTVAIDDPDETGKTLGNVALPVIRWLIDLTCGHCFIPIMFIEGSPDVIVNNYLVVRQNDSIEVHCCFFVCHAGLAMGNHSGVYANNRLVQVQTNGVTCGDTSCNGSPDVFSGA